MPQIASLFLNTIGASVKTIEKVNNGLINATFKVDDEKNNSYILQKINSIVFKNPFDLSHNLLILKDCSELQNIKLTTPTYLSFENKLIIEYDSTFWRMYHYIPGLVHTKSKNNTMSRSAAMALGRFHKLSEHVSISSFKNPIENFTNFQFRVSNFRRALQEGVQSRLIETRNFHSELTNHLNIIEEYCSIEEKVPMRLIHGDPKISNFIFDDSGENILAIIDLDTLGKGSILYDFGDMVRSFSNQYDEYESCNKMKNVLNKDILQSIVEGYIFSTSDFLTNLERNSLLLSAKAVCLVQCIRFYTDYLMGDVYYETNDYDDNLFRAKNQYQLFCELKNLKLKDFNLEF